MASLDNLTAALNDVRSAVALSVEKIQRLANDLALARAEAANSAAIEQIAAVLHSTADQLRSAIASSDQTPPRA
jgi:hypothetical protein